MPRDQLRGLDAWIEGRHITWDPRSPYYNGPECFADGDEDPCPTCGADPGAECRYDDEPDCDGPPDGWDDAEPAWKDEYR